MQQIEKSLGVLDMAKNVTDVGASRKERVDRFNELTFIGEGTLVDLGVRAAVGCPKLDADDVAAGALWFVLRAEEMD